MNRIKELRKARRMNQSELAKICGVSQGALSGWETGRYEPDFTALNIMADLFDVSVDFLLGRDEKKQPINDDELRAQIIDRLNDLPDPALVRTLDFLEGLLAGQETRSKK